MVTVNGVKYACERCIRGHRVSGCRHIGDSLKLVKRKGRPTRDNTQCGNCRKPKLRPVNDSNSCNCDDDCDAPDVQDNPEFEPQLNLTPHDIRSLRRRASVQVKLPDGTILGPISEDKPEKVPRRHSTPALHGDTSPDYSLGLCDKVVYFHDNDPSANYQIRDLMDIDEDELLASDETCYRHNEQYNPGTYSAELYNSSTGNNETMRMNALGVGGYAPNTGTVQSTPRLSEDHDLSVSTQGLAQSLSGLQHTSSLPSDIDEFESYTSSTCMPKLSNLY